jgi:hypothetical protein
MHLYKFPVNFKRFLIAACAQYAEIEETTSFIDFRLPALPFRTHQSGLLHYFLL